MECEKQLNLSLKKRQDIEKKLGALETRVLFLSDAAPWNGTVFGTNRTRLAPLEK